MAQRPRKPPADAPGRLRWWREARGMTQADLAARTYLSRSTISRLETGASARVDLVQLSQLADVLDVGVGDLLPASSLVSLPPPRGARRRRASRTAQGADSLFTAAS